MAGSMDLKISVLAEDGESWQQRSKRFQTLMNEGLETSTQPNRTDYIMDPALLEAAVEANADKFIDAMERISAEKKRNIKGDTALHIAARGGMLNAIEILVCRGKDFPGTDTTSASSSFTSANDFAESTDEEVWYYQNKEGWSPLYMAVKIGDFDIFRLLKAPLSHCDSHKKLGGNPPAHATIIEDKIDMLKEMAEVNPELVQLKDGRGRTVLHWAAHRGNVDAVRFLSSKFSGGLFEMDNKGFFPIHIASEEGSVEVIKELLEQWPHQRELLNREGQNILHVAAKSGKDNVVRFISETPTLEKLLNEKDRNGNTPLHLAAMNSHPAVVLTLTWQKKINIKLLNNESKSAFDSLTNGALISAGARPNFDLNFNERNSYKRYSIRVEEIKELVGIVLLLETLVATVTFSAVFSIPGGYNSSNNPDKGMATILNKHMFQFSVMCNATAFYSSIISIFSILVGIMLIDVYFAAYLYGLSLYLLGLALAMMSLAFMAAIQAGLSQVSWLASYALIMGIISLVIPLLIITIISLPFSCNKPHFMRYIIYYLSRAAVPLVKISSLHGRTEESEIKDLKEQEGSQQLGKDEQQRSLPQRESKQEELQQLRDDGHTTISSENGEQERVVA
ncbi:hypothetical protein GH714_010867 [Hevea brasiliensis]|uniref:PGG domain-containing protein n=1 Tax=Hevea brasiliensis TaxID=3981 RepID=A0A6A6NCC4_HEVBR|nr:hypothetical protein GH714_010867 [Hevea brasiliensis]